jgi:outer membrane protein TolC
MQLQKHLCYFILMVMLPAFNTFAQSVDYQRERETIEILLSDASHLDSLVNNALKNSYYVKSFEGELAQQYENVTQEKNKWLSTFRVGINFFSVNTTVNSQDQAVTTAGFMPNFGITLGIDPEKFINRSSYIREAQYNIVRSENQLKHQRRQIRDEILRLYYQYLEALGIMELRDEANETQKEHCTVIEEKFKKGEAAVEEVLLNQSAYVLTKEALFKTQISVRKLKQEILLFTSDTEPSTQSDIIKK